MSCFTCFFLTFPKKCRPLDLNHRTRDPKSSTHNARLRIQPTMVFQLSCHLPYMYEWFCGKKKLYIYLQIYVYTGKKHNRLSPSLFTQIQIKISMAKKLLGQNKLLDFLDYVRIFFTK